MIQEKGSRGGKSRREDADSADRTEIQRPPGRCPGHLFQVDPEVVPPRTKTESLVEPVLVPLFPFLVAQVVNPAGDVDLFR